jgi:hypothetical protein
MTTRHILERHPYIDARARYVAGLIPACQARAMMAADREFIAECELSLRDVKTEAARVVSEVWRPELCARIVQDKRGACGLFAAPEPEGAKTYCGPTAIAALTGLPIAQIEDAVIAYRKAHKAPKRERKGAARVKGMWLSEIEPTLRALGFKGVGYHAGKRLSFARWLRDTRNGAGRKYLVLVTGHYVAVSNGWFVDTTHRKPVEVSRLLRCKRQRVVAVFEVEGLSND